MRPFSSPILLGYFLCLVSARKYVVEETIQDVPRKTVEINESILSDDNVEPENTLFGQQTENVTKSDKYDFATGIVSYDCLRCICLVESKCQQIGCRMDVGSLSCGYFQIKENYWKDCKMPGKDWKSCAMDIKCASLCVQNYMARYAKHYNCPATCEGYAREHNGGPNGYNNPNTIGYWQRLQRQPGCKGVQYV